MRATCLAPVLALACCEAAPVRPQPTLPLDDCHIDGTDRAARCGVLERPEDPQAPQGRQLPIRVVVIPASDVARHNPLYLLAGGPGQAASEAFAPLLGRFAELGRERDIVLVDQRGTGSSSPLDCELPPDRPLAERLRDDVDLELLRGCLAGYTADPRNFITAIAMDDLDAVRASLAHETIDLLGGSYGTRAALVYARAYPEHVGRIVIDGVAPVDMAMPSSFARDADAALAAMFDDCAAQPECARAFPDAAARFRSWHEQLRARPRKVVVQDPREYARVELELDADLVALSLRSVLYVPALTAMLPVTLQRAQQHDDVGALIAQALVLGDAIGGQMSTGMFHSIVCAEDVPYIDDAALAVGSEGTSAGTRLVELFRETCSVWPRAELPAGYRDPIHLEHPTLVLSGALDPVTPPRWGEHALEGLPNGRHVIVPGTAHGTLTVGCVPELVQSFLDGADALEVGCVDDIARPPFFLDFAGPPP